MIKKSIKDQKILQVIKQNNLRGGQNAQNLFAVQKPTYRELTCVCYQKTSDKLNAQNIHTQKERYVPDYITCHSQ